MTEPHKLRPAVHKNGETVCLAVDLFDGGDGEEDNSFN
jgi:hypothetical protein